MYSPPKRFFSDQLIFIAFCFILTNSALATTPVSPVKPVPNFSGRAQAVQSQIRAILAQIQSITETVQQLLRELNELQRNKPERPSTRGMNEADAYNMQSKYKQKMHAWHIKINKIKRSLEKKQRELDLAQKKLEKIHNQNLPSAQKRDVASAKSRINKTRRKIKYNLRLIHRLKQPCNSTLRKCK